MDIVRHSCTDVRGVILDFLESGDLAELAVTSKTHKDIVVRHINQRNEHVPEQVRLLYGFNKDQWLSGGVIIKQLTIKPSDNGVEHKETSRGRKFYNFGDALLTALKQLHTLQRIADIRRLRKYNAQRRQEQRTLIARLAKQHCDHPCVAKYRAIRQDIVENTALDYYEKHRRIQEAGKAFGKEIRQTLKVGLWISKRLYQILVRPRTQFD